MCCFRDKCRRYIKIFSMFVLVKYNHVSFVNKADKQNHKNKSSQNHHLITKTGQVRLGFTEGSANRLEDKHYLQQKLVTPQIFDPVNRSLT